MGCARKLANRVKWGNGKASKALDTSTQDRKNTSEKIQKENAALVETRLRDHHYCVVVEYALV